MTPTANDLLDALTYDDAARLLHSAAAQLAATARALRAGGQGIEWEKALGQAAGHLADALAELASVHAPQAEAMAV